MATPSAATIQTQCDSIAKHIIDLVALVGSPAAIQAGQATLLGHIAGLNDASQEYSMLPGMEAFVAAENTWITALQQYNSVLDLAYAACLALDAATGGLATFLAAQSIEVDPHYLDAHNRAASRSVITALGAYLAFGNAVVNMGQFNASGAGAGAFVAGSAVGASYGNAPLSIFNAGAGATGAAAGTYTVTYNAYSPSGVLQVGLTKSAIMPAASAAGAAVALGVSGVAVTGISLAGGSNGDQVAVKSALLRAVTY